MKFAQLALLGVVSASVDVLDLEDETELIGRRFNWHRVGEIADDEARMYERLFEFLGSVGMEGFYRSQHPKMHRKLMKMQH